MFAAIVTVLLAGAVAALLLLPRGKADGGPPDAPRVSFLRLIRLLREHGGDFDAVLLELSAEAPLVRLPRLPFLPPLHFVTGDAALAEYHNSKDLSMMEGLKLLIDNYNAAPSKGDAHARRQVQRMARAISPEKHTTFVRTAWEELTRIVDAWPAEGEFDLFPKIYEITTELVTTAVIGRDLAGDALRGFIDDVRTVDPIEGLIAAPWAPLLPRWLFSRTPYGRKLAGAHERAAATVKRLADARVAKLERGEEPETDFFNYMLEVLREDPESEADGKAYDSQELASMCTGLIFAANTNTFATACWTLINLLHHPEHMSAVRAELALARASLPRSSPMTPAFLDRLVHLEACIRESIRIRITASVIRGAVRDTELAGRRVPEGGLVLVKETHVHTLPHVFPEPDRFRPERHLAADGGGIDLALARQGKLIVFGAGRHACIGAKVATQVIKMQVVNFLEGFERLEIRGKVSARTVQFGGVARPAEPVIVEYRKRA
ncbi:cytochrome P450 [Hyaloraphidium curvatum]|nr:cytochrome P450 [Hyaloraphidium curvatum]